MLINKINYDDKENPYSITPAIICFSDQKKYEGVIYISKEKEGRGLSAKPSDISGSNTLSVF